MTQHSSLVGVGLAIDRDLVDGERVWVDFIHGVLRTSDIRRISSTGGRQ